MSGKKIVIEHPQDGNVGYPLGFTRVAIVCEGDACAAALGDTESAIRVFIEHYGRDRFFEHIEEGYPTLDAYIAEASISG